MASATPSTSPGAAQRPRPFIKVFARQVLAGRRLRPEGCAWARHQAGMHRVCANASRRAALPPTWVVLIMAARRPLEAFL